ncbi:MAG: hypothetical protein A2161_08300 [Candidatus Schekmanbacteria bacterium RBG_13_48_7]|uniref:Outer membrane lipoprotein BamD-like domain-containing protein n=1 Tax=Candidatus Schekmanbacteria bacterium RBG_13_48_7 TaxID=1817878 RepID=A0A1F7S822_9BACT|nr:MAG: hypothetical protein A2161_08300 [Candidatus Schekmanbacteria bacterium RBG_13_48_7]
MVVSCSHIDFNTYSDEQLFNLARDKFDRGSYRGAREILIQLKNRFPESKYMAETRLLIADSQFFENNFTEALVQYEIFMKYHPADVKADYVTFQMGLCKKHDINSYDRDQDPTKLAIAAFQQVINNFPNSPFAVQAKINIDDLRLILAQHELYVGKFYLRTKQYHSAIYRLEGMLHDYANLGLDDQCMYFLIKSFVNSNQLEAAQTWFQNLSTQYKESKWTHKTEKEFGDILSNFANRKILRDEKSTGENN